MRYRGRKPPIRLRWRLMRINSRRGWAIYYAGKCDHLSFWYLLLAEAFGD